MAKPLTVEQAQITLKELGIVVQFRSDIGNIRFNLTHLPEEALLALDTLQQNAGWEAEPARRRYQSRRTKRTPNGIRIPMATDMCRPKR